MALTFPSIIEILGTLAFAISGIRLASAKRFDWFGAYVVGLITAIGGGTIRDLLLDTTAFWMLNSIYLTVTAVALLLVIIFGRYLIRLNNTFFIFDTIGLALFVVVGIQKTIAANFPFWIAIIMGTITGAAGGLGDKIARTLHKQGATLALTDMRAEPMEKLKAELGDRVEVFTANLTNPEDVKNLVAQVEEKLGRIDILVNNAGLTRDNLFIRMSDEDWQLVLDVNLSAGFKLAKAAVRGMMKRRFGRIIGIASVVGVTGNAGQANYSASKAGMIAMNKCLAQEVGSRGITVNSIAPGFIRTPMTDVLPEDVKAALLAKIPEGKLGEAQDIANVVAFLASDEAQYITGQTININGGMAMI